MKPPLPKSPSSAARLDQNRSAWPFVGRDAELAHGVGRLAIEGGLAIYGGAGVGKTRLGLQIAEAAKASRGKTGDGTFWVRLAATDARRHLPLSTLEPLLGDLVAGGRVSSLGIGAELDERLRTMAGDRSVLVHLDDAHLLDDASADALAALCRLGRLRLLITVRTQVVVPSSITALWKDEVIDRLDLAPFDMEMTTRLLTEALGGTVTRSTAWKMWNATRGNPFHLRELTRDGLTEGRLGTVDGVWTWKGDMGPGHRVDDLVNDDLRHLNPAEREVVDLVALAEPVPVSSVLAHAEVGTLDAVVERGLVILDDPMDAQPGARPTARLIHPLYAETVRDRVGPDRRRRLLHAASDHDRATGVETLPGLMRSVAWALECDHVPDIDRLLRAAEAALTLGNHDYALRMASTAIDHPNCQGDARVIDALTLRARAWRQRTEPDRARTDLDGAADALGRLVESESRQVELATAIAVARAELVQFVDDNPDAAASILEQLITDHADVISPPERALWELEIRARRLTGLAWAGRFDLSLDAGLDLLAEPDLDVELRLPMVAPLVLGLVARGRFDDALALAEAEMPLARNHPDAAPWALADIAAARFTALLCSGRIDEMAGPFAGTTSDQDQLLRFDRTLQQMGAGLRAATAGRWEDAHRDLRAAAVEFERDDPRGLRANALAQLARSSVATGSITEARQAMAAFRASPLRASRAVGGQLRLAVAAAAVALDEPGALDDLMDLADEAAERGDRFIELSALHLLAVTHSASSDGATRTDTDDTADRSQLLKRVRDLDGAVDSPAGPLLVQHAEAVLTDQSVLARALASSVTQAGVWLPPTSLQVDLSPRQREVASLAASGLSSREIATQLHLSVRTVDTHLSHIFTKLGINRRGALAAALAGMDTGPTTPTPSR